MIRELRVDAFAKLTLSLRVLGTRADGLHELEALTVSLNEPHDALLLQATDSLSITVDGLFAAGVPVDRTNLAWRAAEQLGANLAIRLHKGIPHGGGLGGGSADAAAVLLGARALLDLDVDDDALHEVGAQLGADVPFCLRGGAAWMRGAGERLAPASIPPLVVVVATPPFGCATPDVYRAWDALGGPSATRAITIPDVDLAILGNDLEPAAEHAEPRLRQFRALIEDAAKHPALLAGSGSSYAMVFAHVDDAERARSRVARAIDTAVFGAAVFLGSTAPAGVALQP